MHEAFIRLFFGQGFSAGKGAWFKPPIHDAAFNPAVCYIPRR